MARRSCAPARHRAAPPAPARPPPRRPRRRAAAPARPGPGPSGARAAQRDARPPPCGRETLPYPCPIDDASWCRMVNLPPAMSAAIDRSAATEEADVTAIPSRLAGGRIHYAWIIAAVTFVVALLTAGVRAAPGVLIVPLEQEFHWSRATISFAVGVNLLLYGAIGPFAAAIMDRFGVRRTMCLAMTVTTAAVALSPLMREAWQLILIWGVAVGLGCGFIGAYLAAYIAARWFKTQQGLVVGILTAA